MKSGKAVRHVELKKHRTSRSPQCAFATGKRVLHDRQGLPGRGSGVGKYRSPSDTADRHARSHGASIIWECHRAGHTIGYCHIEKMHNLESIPDDGFGVSGFPVKVHAASAGWTQAVAIFSD